MLNGERVDPGSTSGEPAHVCVHPNTAVMARALSPHAAWFEVAHDEATLPSSLAGRATLHRHGSMRALTVDALTPADVPLLAAGRRFAFMNLPGVIQGGEADLESLLARSGIEPVFRHGDAPGSGRPHRRMGSAEFLLSDRERLRDSHVFRSTRMLTEQARARADRTAVALLDLVQDFEVLRPLLLRAASPDSGFLLHLSVSDRVLKSTAWPMIESFARTLEVPWFTPASPTDVVRLLGSAKALLLTASESTAAAHAFGHSVCRMAPPRTFRVTMQHGLECIGLRHHRAHDFDFPHGVRFASDLVLTWDHLRHLPDVHPGEQNKCVPVGVIKTIAERASMRSEHLWADGVMPVQPAQATRLLLAENLHSVRFRSPARYQRFMRFVEEAAAKPGLEVTIRSHPASRILEKQREENQLKFLDGTLRLEDLTSFDAFVSPPSTILLDSVLAGTATAVWSDGPATGECANYQGLPIVADFADWCSLRERAPDPQQALAWAIDSTAALNGAPAAWDVIRGMFE